MRLTIESLGVPQFQRDLDRWKDNVTDLRPAWRSIAQYFYGVERRLFAGEGRSGDHGKWAPLAPTTLARKLAHGLDSRILRERGNLYASLTGRGGYADKLIDRDSMRVSTTLPYARFHQTGTRRMPMRRPVDLTEAQKREMVKRVQHFLVYGDLGGFGG